jgi:hypothetical protein
LGFSSLNWKSGKDLIGIDFFSGNQILDQKMKEGTIDSQYKDDKTPRFCCVGANGWGVTSKTRYAKQADITSNMTSILALLIWPGAKHASYYTGGDGFPHLELDCIGKFLAVNQFIEGSVTVVKLDHHGSSHEFSSEDRKVDENIVDQLKPKRVIVTPGDQYGHPGTFLMRPLWHLLALIQLLGWDVVTYIREYYSQQRTVGGDILFTTRMPYWTTKELLSGKDLRVGKIETVEKMLEDRLKGLNDVNFTTPWSEFASLFGPNAQLLAEESEQEDPEIEVIDVLVDKFQSFKMIDKKGAETIAGDRRRVSVSVRKRRFMTNQCLILF